MTTGDAIIEPESISLTTGKQGELGGLWTVRPVLNSGANWQIEFDFQIQGESNTKLYGDGLALWYTKESLEKGTVFGNRDRWNGLGIFFDTYDNTDHSGTISKCDLFYIPTNNMNTILFYFNMY